MEQNKAALAEELFNSTFNCAQSVIGAWVPEAVRPEALRMATAYGGGILGGGALCGAACGALMAIGYTIGKDSPDDTTAKEKTNTTGKLFLQRFQEQCSHVNCHDLLGCNPQTEEGKAHMAEHGLREKVCTQAVVKAIRILEELAL